MPEKGAAPRTFVVGVGYTGSRLLEELPDGVGVSRGDEPDFGSRYNVVYTAPPLGEILQNRLAKMEPPPGPVEMTVQRRLATYGADSFESLTPDAARTIIAKLDAAGVQSADSVTPEEG